MKYPVIKTFVVIVSLLILAIPTAWSASPPAVGGTIPEFSLTSPKDSAERDYLGLSFLSRSFRVTDLKTQMVIIEIFNMYCPYCQAEAPNVNLLYEKINTNPSLKGKINIIGIGAANTVFEVAVFKNKYHVPFPLFPDDDLKIHKLMGEVKTPYFIVVKLNGDSRHEVIFSQLGALGPVDPFLAEMITRSGLKKKVWYE